MFRTVWVFARAALTAFGILAAAPALAQDKVTFNMSWLPQGSVIGPIVAVDKGFYREAGLEVTLVRGYGGNRTANELDQGQFQFGYVDPVSLMLNRSNGGTIRLVGAINTRWPGGICFVEGKVKDKSLDSLKGLQMGGGSASPVHNYVPAWLEMNGKARDHLRLLRMDPAVVDASLIEGKTDLAECWRASNRAVLRKQAASAGVRINWIEYSDFGLNSYGSGFATTEEIIRTKPDLVRRFLRASYQGYQFALTNPEQAADIMVKTYPTVDRGVALEQIQDISDLLVDPQSPDRRLGYLRDDRIRSTTSFVDKAFSLAGKIKPEQIYTNDLLK
jgi:NitT/TauT family transport system substrate-binding protein